MAIPDEKAGDIPSKEAMLAELVDDPYFEVSRTYADIFTRMAGSDTRGEACEDFQARLEEDRVQALISILAWKGDCSGMDCNSFIFAMYDTWFDPLTPKAIWKIHIATDCCRVSPNDSMFVLAPLAQVMGEALKTGTTEYIDQLRAATPTGARGHFLMVEQKVGELFA